MTNDLHHHHEETNMGYTTPVHGQEAIVPHNIEAEQQILGSLLLNNDLFHRISDILSEEHFFDPVHGAIYGACVKRIRNAHMVDPVILKGEFSDHEGLKQIGGAGYLVRLVGAAVSGSAIRDYAAVVIDAFQRRVMLAAIAEAQRDLTAGGDLATIQAGIEIAGSKVAAADAKPPTVSMTAAATKALDMAYQAWKGDATGLITGIKAFDDLTGGLFPEDFIVIGAAPSMGKTALALALTKAYGQAGKGTAFVSLEMGDYSLAQRLMSNLSGVPHRDMRRGSYNGAQGAEIKRAAMTIAEWPIQIVQGHVRDVAGIYAAARRIQRAMDGKVPGGLRVLIVDYLQLVRAPAKDRFQMVAEVSMGLKNIAKQMGIPVVALAQINARSVSDRDDKRPKLADLRESGQIEQDADMVMMLHREDYWLERMGPQRGKDGKVSVEAMADHEAARSAARHQMDVILAKHRHDGIGEIKLGCDMATNRIWDLHSGDVEGAMGFI